MTDEAPAVSGILSGTRGGFFRYFTVDYPGGGEVVQITLDSSESYGQMGRLLGFNIYGPTGLVASARPAAGDPWSTRARASFSRIDPGEFTVQLFSYVDGKRTYFTINAEGLDFGGRRALAGSDNRAFPDFVQAGNGFLAGNLTGDSAGAIRFFNLDYPGNTDLVVSLTYSPPFLLSSRAVGVQLYDRETPVAEGHDVGRDKDATTHRLAYRDSAPHILGLQLYNYRPGLAVDFTIEVEGLGDPITFVDDNTGLETVLDDVPGELRLYYGAADTCVGLMTGQNCRRAGLAANPTGAAPGLPRLTVHVSPARHDVSIMTFGLEIPQ